MLVYFFFLSFWVKYCCLLGDGNGQYSQNSSLILLLKMLQVLNLDPSVLYGFFVDFQIEKVLVGNVNHELLENLTDPSSVLL